MILRYEPSSQAYFAFGVTTEEAMRLSMLMWQPHPKQAGTWWSRSPYLAAPLWNTIDAQDAPTRQALHVYAWNYQTSFAKYPLDGTGVNAIRVPAGETPYPFQIAGVQRAVMRNKILIADDPGAGKTLQALVVSNMVRPNRIVIGCPTHLVYNWANECERWLVDPRSIAVLDGAKKNVPEKGVIILPYSRGHSFAARILAGPPIDHLIADEIHWIKNPNSQRTGPWLDPDGLFAKAKRVTALSGTPSPNNPLEMHQLLQRLTPETMGKVTRDQFQALYCTTTRGTAKVARKNGGEASVQFETNEGKNQDALNAELRASGVMVRRLKDHVLDQLPPKRVYLVHLTPTAQIEELVREEASLYDMLQTRILTAQELISIQGHIANVRARLGQAKAPKIAEYIKHIFESGETRVVCFMLHREAMALVQQAFDHTRIRVRMLTGDQAPKQRQADVDAFQRLGGYELALGQVIAAGTGLTMTAARYVVLGEIAWTPATNDQAIDRVHRISQTRSVMAPIITFPHAVEERVITANAKKAISAQRILDANLMNVFGRAA